MDADSIGDAVKVPTGSSGAISNSGAAAGNTFEKRRQPWCFRRKDIRECINPRVFSASSCTDEDVIVSGMSEGNGEPARESLSVEGHADRSRRILPSEVLRWLRTNPKASPRSLLEPSPNIQMADIN